MTTEQQNTLGSEPVDVFQGYDTFSGRGRSAAVQGMAKAAGGSQQCNYTVCQSSESLYKALGISAEVAASFGFGGVSAKSEYVNVLETTSTSIVIAIYANKVLGRQQYTSVQLRDGLRPPRTRPEVSAFYQAHGDGFVSDITMGAEYIATYTFYCQSIEERTRVSTELQARGISMRGQVSARLQTAIEEVQRMNLSRSGFRQQVLGFSNLRLPKPEEMIEFALSFGTRTPDAPIVIGYETSGYEHVPGMDAQAWAQVRANRELFGDNSGGRSVNGQAAALRSLVNEVAWIRHIYHAYDYQQDTDLADRRMQIDRDVEDLRDAIRELEKDPLVPFSEPKLESLAWGYPVLNFDGPVQPVAWGEHGGAEFSDVARQAIRAGRILREVLLTGGSYLDSIASTFSDGTSIWHGGTGGREAPPLILGEHEYITELVVRAGRYVDQLEVISSAGQRTEAGGEGGVRSSWKVPQGWVVVGFGGRSDWYIDRIGPLVCAFKPATWKRLPSAEFASTHDRGPDRDANLNAR
jgi:hypothetical protein